MNPLDLAQQLAQRFAGRADEADRKGKLPPEDIQDLQNSDYPALNVPKELGGYGLSMRDSVAAQLELAQGSTSTALVAGMHMHVMAHNAEIREWDDNFYKQLCQEIIRDGALVNSVASEPKLGSPSRGGSFQTYAELIEEERQWRVNGHKTWTTGSPYLTYMLVKLSVQGGNGIMVIRKGTPGLRIEQTWGDALSLRASDSHDVYFDDVVVPYENLIQQVEGRGPSNLWFPMVMAATYLGAGFAARTAVIQFALERVPTALGRPIATLPKIQRQIGEIDVALQAARS
ncbi:MAG: acyl-CoA/acyl-ACP dehydrogenase, partial [Anaerolineales bacterium]|nr:acyl-CoA/acyl-ACP dehydrogenase [Anaerolineales bacterium]